MTRDEDSGTSIKVAVLGGGMGGLAAAWQLLRLDPKRYDITVYQRGWRLGGKAASGRNREPGQALRIEEHGLHILMGFYDHVFHILRTCYDDLGPEPDSGGQGGQGGIGTWPEALSGSDHLHVCDKYRDGQYAIWELQLPAHSLEAPGSSPPEDPDVSSWLGHGLAFIYELVQQDSDPGSGSLATPGQEAGGAPALRWLHWLVRALSRRESNGARLRSDLLGEVTRTSLRWALTLLFRRIGDPERRDPVTMTRRRQAIAGYFVGANLLGIMNNDLWRKRDFLRYAERIDHLDYRQWLRQNSGPIGESWPDLTWDSALVKAVYDLIFSRQSGFGAGTALYDTLCMLLGYRGRLYYRMNGGMGDLAFAPLYLWLRQRGVKFRFFERVRKLQLEAGSPRRVGQIWLERQVDLDGELYDPLFPVHGRACWPSAPLLERLPAAERKRLQREGADLESGSEQTGTIHRLRRGSDFDLAVLGVPVGVFQHEPELVGELAAAHPPFARMVAGITTTATRAFQIWTDQDAPGLGWKGRPGMLGAYEHPFASWADMTQVLSKESWDQAQPVRGVHYFCGAGEPESSESQADQRVEREAVDWLQACLPGLLPRWSWKRATAHYWRVNSSPSERYVLAAPGTLRFRLAADQSGFENLYLAGDWVRTDLNAGCLEAAAMAGVAAARAIHGRIDKPARTRSSLAVRAQGAHLRAYVDRDSDWVLRAPVRAEAVTTALFVLHGDPEALADICVAQIERPTGGRVTARPWPAHAGLVMLLCSRIPRLASGDPIHGEMGHFVEQDVGFFVPVSLTGGHAGERINLLAPYLFVDSAIGLLAGREIYGFSKLLANIDMPSALPGHGFSLPPQITVSADVLGPASPGSGEAGGGRCVQRSVVLEVVPGGARRLPRALGRLLPPLTRTLARFDPAHLGLPMVFLKQFRDAAAPAQACHQSLVQCRAHATLASAPRPLPGTFVVRLPHHDKPDLARTLGLPSELEPLLALQLEHDLYLPAGRQLWP